MSSMTTEKVIIIGGGPTGIAASLYNARAHLAPLVLAGSPAGGQLMLTSHVENYPGFESVLGPDLIARMRRHAQKFGVRFIDANVSRVDFSRKPFQIFLSDGKTAYMTECVLIATGAEALWLNLSSEQKLRGKGVSACATCDGFFFKNKIVGVVGGGDTAMEEALTLTKFASKVFIIHRKDTFRASKIMQKRVFDNPKIEVIWNTQVEEVLGENKVEGILLEVKGEREKPSDSAGGAKVLSVDGLFVAIGHKPATDFLKNSGVLLDEKGYVMTSGMDAFEKAKGERIKAKGIFDFNYHYMTSVAGVFAAGDVIDPYYRQAATAVGMGVAAALEIERYVG